MSTPDLLTVDEAAGILKASADAVRRYCHAGQLRAHRLPGHRGAWRIPAEAIGEMLERNSPGATVHGDVVEPARTDRPRHLQELAEPDPTAVKAAVA